MTLVVFAPRGRRRHGCEFARKRNASIALVYGPLLATLVLGAAINSVDAEPSAVALVPASESAVALIPPVESVSDMRTAAVPAAKTSSVQRSADLSDDHLNFPGLIARAAVLASVDATGSIPDQSSDAQPPKPVLQTPPAILIPPNCTSAIKFASLLAIRKCPQVQAATAQFDSFDISPIMNAHAGAADDDDVSPLRLAQLPLKPLVLRPLALPASIEARIGRSGDPPIMIVGIASMYNPGDPHDRDAGDAQTASGELYDGAAWTAAIRTDLRGKFGGVRYGRNYRPAYALVEAGSKRAIIKINDVGPLAFGRVIDLNKRTMRYFDPSLQLGLIHGMRVVALPGKNWKPGPVDDVGEKIILASASGM